MKKALAAFAFLFAFQQLGNAANRVAADATAFSYRNARYDCVIISGWEDPSEEDANIRWAREVYDALMPLSTGATYLNTLGFSEDLAEGRVKEAFLPATYQRLVALKRKYDPTNLFRLNANINPGD